MRIKKQTILCVIITILLVFSPLHTEAKVLQSLADKKAGSMMKSSEIDWKNLNQYFQSYKIDSNVSKRITNKSYKKNSNISLSQLRYIKVLHYNFKHNIQVGELIVNENIADDCRKIFKELFEGGYEIQNMRLIDDYWTKNADATDTASMKANNSSAFCYRVKTNGKTLSNHALGYAIDINPVQNPYVTGSTILPSNGKDYVKRTTGKAHMITSRDLCCKVFKKYGFTWGGDWKSPKDYQHFEKKVSTAKTVTVSMKNSGTSIVKGNKVSVVASIKNVEAKKVAYQSSAKSIATVDSKGLVTGKKAGMVKITAAITAKNNKIYKKTITVYVKDKATSKTPYITLSGKQSVVLGDTITIKQSLKVSKSSIIKSSYKSSNTKAATVNGKGVVTAKKSGTATITVTSTTKSGHTMAAKRKVTVRSK